MANYSNLIAAIQATIYNNGQNLITGSALQGVLIDMVQELGQAGAVFGGVVDRDFTPAATDSNIFYVASVPGTYSGFGQSVSVGEFAIFYFDGSDWQKATVTSAEVEVTPGSENGITLATINVGGQNYLIKAEVKDSTPTPNSTRPVESGGVSAAITAVASSTAAALALKADKTYVDNQLALKADKVAGAVNGNMAALDAGGNLVDSGIASSAVGDVANKIDRVAGAGVGNVAMFDAIGGIEDSEVPADNIAQQDGYYSTLIAGAAENLVGQDVQTAQFTRRVSGGSADVGTGAALIKSIKGNTLVWNEIVTNGNFTSTTGWNVGDTCSLSASNNELSLTIGSGVQSSTSSYQSIPAYIVGHKYYISEWVYSPRSVNFVYGLLYYLNYAAPVTANQWTRLSMIKQVTGSHSVYRMTIASNLGSLFQVGDVIKFRNAMVIDLTQMFGAGNEPTAAEFEALFPLNYYANVTPFLLNNKAASLVTTGFNQLKFAGRTEDTSAFTHLGVHTFSEDKYIKGYAATDYKNVNQITSFQITDNSVTVLTANSAYGIGLPMRCWPSTQYYIQVTKSGSGSSINTIGFYDIDGVWISKSEVLTNPITTPANCYWMVFNVVPVANNASVTYSDICINLSDVNKNGTYEPYEKHTLTLNLTGLTSGGTAIFADGMKSAASVYDEVDGAKAVKRIGSRAYQAGDESDTSVKTDGTTTYYALTTPEEYTLDAPLSMQYEINNDGTEEITPENGSTPTTAPFLADIQYAMNAVDTLRNLPKNYISKASMDSILTAFKTAGVITAYTLTWDATNQKYNCTITV